MLSVLPLSQRRGRRRRRRRADSFLHRFGRLMGGEKRSCFGAFLPALGEAGPAPGAGRSREKPGRAGRRRGGRWVTERRRRRRARPGGRGEGACAGLARSRPSGPSGARGSGGHDGQRRGQERSRGAPRPPAARSLGVRAAERPPSSSASPRGRPGRGGGGAGRTWPVQTSGSA